jgi:signal transduction histidine kinase
MDRPVFALAPSGKDARLIDSALSRCGFAIQTCRNVADAIDRADDGIGALLVAEEALVDGGDMQLQRFIARQPSWSDLPVLLLTTGGHVSELAARAIDTLGNVTVIERPTQIATLASAVRTALRTRERQYEMREADARKDMFLATLAHELRNPLAPLSNALHVIQAADHLDTQHQWAAGVMQRQISQLARLVDDLMDVARITRGKITLRKERVDVREIIRAGVETALPAIQAMNHELTLDMPSRPVWAQADATRLAQCVSNLLCNAAKYTGQNGRIDVSVSCHEQEIHINVRDNGIGFRQQDARRLFEVFAQVEEAAHRAQGGLGLGLSIVKALIEMHGGSVHAHSEGEGRGATFSLHLPGVSDSLPDHTMTHSRAHHSSDIGATCRIMVVDDNRDSADSMAEMLQIMGHDVRTAYDGKSGMALLDDWTPHVALLDIGLPDMSGHELAGLVRGRLQQYCPVLIAITGWGQAIDLVKSRDAGFDHHLTKPAEIDKLLNLIDEIAHKSKAAI